MTCRWRSMRTAPALATAKRGYDPMPWPMQPEPCVQATGGIGVYFADGDKRNVSEPLAVTEENPATNNRAEITAIIRALEVIDATEPPSRPVVIKSDSVRACAAHERTPAHRTSPQVYTWFLIASQSYCINAITSWLKGWQRKGWRGADMQPVKVCSPWSRWIHARSVTFARIVICGSAWRNFSKRTASARSSGSTWPATRATTETKWRTSWRSAATRGDLRDVSLIRL